MGETKEGMICREHTLSQEMLSLLDIKGVKNIPDVVIWYLI